MIDASMTVCHHVSTIEQFSFPIVLKYHTSGLIGSPVVPNRRSDDKSKVNHYESIMQPDSLLHDKSMVRNDVILR